MGFGGIYQLTEGINTTGKIKFTGISSLRNQGRFPALKEISRQLIIH
jgi:hypothetical protein